MRRVGLLAILTAVVAGGGCATLGVIDDACADMCVSCSRGSPRESGDSPPDAPTGVFAPIPPAASSLSSVMSY